MSILRPIVEDILINYAIIEIQKGLAYAIAAIIILLLIIIVISFFYRNHI